MVHTSSTKYQISIIDACSIWVLHLLHMCRLSRKSDKNWVLQTLGDQLLVVSSCWSCDSIPSGSKADPEAWRHHDHPRLSFDLTKVRRNIATQSSTAIMSSQSNFYPVFLSIARNPVTAVGLPLALGTLSGLPSRKATRGYWYQVCNIQHKGYILTTYALSEANNIL